MAKRSGMLTGKARESIQVKPNRDDSRVELMTTRWSNARDIFSGLPLIGDELVAWHATNNEKTSE